MPLTRPLPIATKFVDYAPPRDVSIAHTRPSMALLSLFARHRQLPSQYRMFALIVEGQRIPIHVMAPVLEVHRPLSLPHHQLVLLTYRCQHVISLMMHVNSLKTASVTPILRQRLVVTAQKTPTALTAIHAKPCDLMAAVHALLLDVIGVPRMHCA